MIARWLDVAGKGWRYSLAALAEPARVPSLAWNTGAQKVHLGELLKLQEHRKWLQAANIRTVVDVGANAGQFSSAIRCFVPEAQIYAFEPLPDCYEFALSSARKTRPVSGILHGSRRRERGRDILAE